MTEQVVSQQSSLVGRAFSRSARHWVLAATTIFAANAVTVLVVGDVFLRIDGSFELLLAFGLALAYVAALCGSVVFSVGVVVHRSLESDVRDQTGFPVRDLAITALIITGGYALVLVPNVMPVLGQLVSLAGIVVWTAVAACAIARCVHGLGGGLAVVRPAINDVRTCPSRMLPAAGTVLLVAVPSTLVLTLVSSLAVTIFASPDGTLGLAIASGIRTLPWVLFVGLTIAVGEELFPAIDVDKLPGDLEHAA